MTHQLYGINRSPIKKIDIKLICLITAAHSLVKMKFFNKELQFFSYEQSVTALVMMFNFMRFFFIKSNLCVKLEKNIRKS
jgi:hypothetical protein